MSDNQSQLPLPSSSRGFSIKNAKHYTPQPGQEFQLHAYYLLPSEKVNEKMYGIGVFVGGYPSAEAAEDKAKKINEENPHLSPHWRIWESGKWFVYTPEINPEDVDYYDQKGQEAFVNQERREREEKIRKIKEEEERRKIQQERELDLLDDESVLHYTKIQLQKQYQEKFNEQRRLEIQRGEANLARIQKRLSDLELKHPDYPSRWESEGLPQLQ